MDNVFMIHLDDYIRHIDEKLELYAMLRQLEDAIGKLPECRSTAEARRRMAAFSPKLKKLWEGWNIPRRYLVSGELDDLCDVMDDELMEPEDAGYFSEGSDIRAGGDAPAVPELADHELLLGLMDTADKLYDNYAALIELARRQLRRSEE